jgi:hypothetical protein
LSESSKHIALVQAIKRWIETQTDFPKQMAILIASPNSPPDHQPPSVGGRIPDVFAQSSELNRVIIGEAKTTADIETQRSRNQFTDYLRFLGTQEQAMLVVAVPWDRVNQARSLLRSIQEKTKTHHVKITVLEKLPG